MNSQAKVANRQIRAMDSMLYPTKRDTKKALTEQGFLTEAETFLGCFGFSITNCQSTSHYLKKRIQAPWDDNIPPDRHTVGPGCVLVWYLLAALLWHTQRSPHLQGCPTSKTSDNNIQVLIVNKQHCKHQPNLRHLLFFLRPRGNFELISQTTEG